MRAYLVFLILPFSFSLADNGELKGKIYDLNSQKPLSEVNISLLGTDLGTTTDSSGKFILKNISPGIYNISTTFVGYSPVVKDEIEIKPELSIYIEIGMQSIPIELENIIVNSGYSHNYNINSFAKLTGIEAKRVAGNFNDVLRSVSMLPGIAKPDDYRNDLVVRGGSPSENLFLIDGVIVPNINHFGSLGFTGGPVSFIDPTYIKNMSFSSGGFPVAYGDKLSSVLDLELLQGDNEKVSGGISASGTQFGINADGYLSEQINFLFSLRRSFLDPVFKIYGFNYYPEYYDLLSKLNWKINNKNSIELLFIGALDKVKFFNTPYDERNENPRAIGSNQSRFVAAMIFKHIFNNGFINLNFSKNYFVYNTVPNYFFNNHSYEIENSLKGDLTYKILENHKLDIGFAGALIRSRTDAVMNNYITSYNERYNFIIDKNFLLYKFGSYIQYSYNPGLGLSFNTGLRLDYFSPLKEEKTLSPRISVKYNFNENSSIGFSSGIYYQTPSYIWLSGDTRNGRLKSLKAEHYVISMDHILKNDFKIKLEGYFKNYKNYTTSLNRPYLVLANTGAGFSGIDDNFASFGLETLTSDGKGNSKGFELSLRKSGIKDFYFGEVNISYSETYFYGIDGVKRIGSFNQKWIVNIFAGYFFDEHTSANIKFFLASGKPYSPFNEDGTQKISDYNTLKMTPMHSLDLRIERILNFSNYDITLYLDIKNIYNQKNINKYFWDPITEQVSYDPVIRILPSIGVTIKL